MSLWYCTHCERAWVSESAADTCEQICSGTAYLYED